MCTRASRIAAVLALSLACLVARAGEEPRSFKEIAYRDSGRAAPRSRTLDLYLPRASDRRPPLLAFVSSRFWRRAEYERDLEQGFVAPLRDAGAAVAVIRHREAPEFRHPDHVRDVAAAVAYLVANADRYGYDPARIVLSGHSSGGHLASLLALDPSYLAEVGLTPAVLKAVVSMSGIYDLDPEELSAEERALYEGAFGDAAARRAASPARLLRADAPRFVLLGAEDDIPGYVAAARDFAAALRAAGHPDAEAWFAPDRDHFTLLDLRDERCAARAHLLAALELQPLPPEMRELTEGVRHWRDPQYSTEGFWERPDLIETHEADPRFVAMVRRIFTGLNIARQKTWSAERYHAIDLFAWLDALGPDAGSGRFLTLTNVRNEKMFFDLDEIREYEPVIVVGIDDERNLFRIRDLLRAKREYSWVEPRARLPFLAAPLGAFVFFRQKPPPHLEPHTYASYALLPESFRRSEEDPLAPLSDLSPALVAVLTHGNGCVYCHSFRGVGTKAGHLRLVDGEPTGGWALPLVSYPPEVWRRFVYEQEAVAEEIGTTTNPVPEEIAPLLYAVVEQEREAGGPSR